MKKNKFSIMTILLILSLMTSCNSTQTQDTSVELGESVSEITTVPVQTTTITTEVTTTYPILTEDTFSGEDLEIYHTDFQPSQELHDEIMELINNYGTNCSFYMVNLEDYATFGYNSDSYIATASTIKFPFAYYCYQEIEKGNYSLDDEILYESGYYSSGTGVLKDNGSGTYYSIRDLLYYMIHYSDNVAFLMLQDYFGYEGYNEMLSNDGFETFLDGDIRWGKISSHALGYYWSEVYKYKDECEEGAIFFDTLVNAGSNFLIWPFTEAGYEYKIAHKSGWASPGYHDSGIVLSEHPFVIVVMTDSDGEERDNSFFYNMVLTLNELHDEYLEYLGQNPSVTGELPSDMYDYLDNYIDGYDEHEKKEETTTTITTTEETTTEETTTTEEITTEDTTTSTETEEVVTTVTTITETEIEDVVTTEEYQGYQPETTTVAETTTPYVVPSTTLYTYEDPNQNTEGYEYYDDNNLYF